MRRRIWPGLASTSPPRTAPPFRALPFFHPTTTQRHASPTVWALASVASGSTPCWSTRCHELGVRLAWGARVLVAPKQPLHLDGEACIYRYAIGAEGQSSRMRDAMGQGPGQNLKPPLRCPLSLPHRAVEPHGGSPLERPGPGLHHPRRCGGNLRGHRSPRPPPPGWSRFLKLFPRCVPIYEAPRC